jgi:hypothetical protein
MRKLVARIATGRGGISNRKAAEHLLG